MLNGTIFKGTVLYLVRVPVAVKDDNSVSRLQVQPQTSCSGTQQEDKVLIGRIIKVLQQRATILSLSGSYKDKRTILARLYCQWFIDLNELSKTFQIKTNSKESHTVVVFPRTCKNIFLKVLILCEPGWSDSPSKRRYLKLR